MQSLFYGLIGIQNKEQTKEQTKEQNKKDVVKDFKKVEEYETIGCPEDQTINQIHRKIKLMNDFKIYIQKANTDTVYYKYIINTNIYEYENNESVVYTIISGIFGNLNEYRTSENTSNDIFRTLAFLEL